MTAHNVPARLLRVFLSELDERLNTFDADVNALAGTLSNGDRSATVTRLFRDAHSLKGAAASIGASGIETVCQQLEDVLAHVRDGDRTIDATLCRTLLAGAEQLREAGRELTPEAPRQAPPGRRVYVSDTTLRVAADAIDGLLEQSSDLLVAHHRIDDVLRSVDETATMVQRLHSAPPGAGRKRRRDEMREVQRSLDRIAAAMQAERAALQRTAQAIDASIRSIRIVPFGIACEGLERVVHDTAEATGKRVRLEITGADIGLDRVMIERLRDPLVQLVRNAVDHGIEPPAERVQAGKPANGTVQLSVMLREGEVSVSVRDDGRGLDLEALRRRVRERGLSVDEAALPQAVFLPGVSTAASVTNLSGRGVGLDVVRAEIEALDGSADVLSERNGGTTFVLNFPMTSTTVRAILVAAAGQTFGFNVTSVERTTRVDAASVTVVEGRPVLLLGERALPLVPLHTALGIDVPGDRAPQSVAVIVRRGDRSVALGVDALLDEREVHLRALGPRLSALPYVSGAAIGGDGSIALILRGRAVVEGALRAARTAAPPASGPARAVKRVLLVDDSVTTRALECSILEAAGFTVLTAPDGLAAWALLGEQTVDVVVSDVDMPRMDGFGLVEAIRASASLRALPVVLVTGRGDEADRRRGLEAGADAYIVKSSFRQEELLETIGALT